MNFTAFQPSEVLAIIPEMSLVILAGIILLVDLLYHDREKPLFGWIAAAGFLIIAVLAALFSKPGAEAELVFGGMLRNDWASFTFRLIFLLGAAITVLIGCEGGLGRRHAEYCALVVIATLGMSLMASSANLIMLYLAIETTSLPLYIMAGFRVLDQKSVEAGMKYLLYGAMASAVMLYGFSLLWGFTGTTNIYEIADQFQAGRLAPLLMAVQPCW